MKFTTSTDGVPRANFYVKFRVDCGALEHAAGALIWSQLVEEMYSQDEDVSAHAEEFAAKLGKREVIDKIRLLLQANGYEVWLHDTDDFWEFALDAARPVVQALFPEAYSERSPA